MVRGEWKYSGAKKDGDYAWRLRNLEVEGQPFELPRREGPFKELVEMYDLTLADIRPFQDAVFVEPKEGQIWEMEAYELFAFDGIPGDVQLLYDVYTSTPRVFGRYAGLCWRRLRIVDSRVH